MGRVHLDMLKGARYLPKARVLTLNLARPGWRSHDTFHLKGFGVEQSLKVLNPDPGL